MKRNIAHVLFGAAALAFGIGAVYQGFRLHQIDRVNDAVAQANTKDLSSGYPEARFARAQKLAQAGNVEATVQIYKDLSRGGRADLSRYALYNLGNLHMREALKNGPDEAIRSLPLIELAKQSYRDLLRREPNDWDARYNLELALQIAPEADDVVNEEPPEENRERSMSTVQGTRIDLP